VLLEIHCHTAGHSPCSHANAVDLVRQISRRGLEGVVITDHQFLWPEDELRALRREAGVPDFFLIFSGQEVSTSDMGDVLVYGAGETISGDTPTGTIRAEYPDAALILAHPYRNGKRPGQEVLNSDLLDGVEIFSSNHSVSENTRGLKDWHQYKFTATAGTDTHGVKYAGLYPTLFDHPVETIAGLAKEIREGRCRLFFKEIPKAGATLRVDEITIGTKGENGIRERIIVKKFQNKEKWLAAERAFYIMEEISRHGFDGGPYRVPRLIEEDKESMILIEEGLRGSSLFEKLVRSGPEDAKHFVQISAQWLARLHNQRLQITPLGEFLETEQVRLRRYLVHFDNVRHRHTGRAREIMEAVLAAETALLQGRQNLLVQGHGDFHPKNIYIGQNDLNKPETLFVAAIDFSSSYCLPAGFDVGTFLAQFQNQFIDYPEILQEIREEVFLDAYLSTVERVESDLLRQAGLFRARTNLSIASFLIKVGLGESENLWRVLVDAERALAQFEFTA
jgi:3',5'-nucleoside bisphosphate phosphatase